MSDDAPDFEDELAPDFEDDDEDEIIGRLYEAINRAKPLKRLALEAKSADRRLEELTAEAWRLANEMNIYPQDYDALKRVVLAALRRYWGEKQP